MNGAPTCGGTTMEHAHRVLPSACCWNPHGTDYGNVGQGTIRRCGRTQAGTQRSQRRTCSGTFVETLLVQSRRTSDESACFIGSTQNKAIGVGPLSGSFFNWLACAFLML